MENRIFKIRCSQIGKIMSNAKVKGELSQTCKTYLNEWFANDNEQIHSKYIDKGNAVENDLIDFKAEGAGNIVAVDSADFNSHEPYQATTRKAFQGMCFAMLKANKNSGKITLTATSPNLKSASITINASK